MAVPHRGNTGYSVYFITASAFQQSSLFQTERMARLFVEVLFHYRERKKYLLHEFVLMPNHFHLLITPTLTLERALQFIKGGFSYRAKKELGFGGVIWRRASTTGECGMWRSTLLIATTFARTRSRKDWQPRRRSIPIARPDPDLCWMKSLSG